MLRMAPNAQEIAAALRCRGQRALRRLSPGAHAMGLTSLALFLAQDVPLVPFRAAVPATLEARHAMAVRLVVPEVVWDGPHEFVLHEHALFGITSEGLFRLDHPPGSAPQRDGSVPVALVMDSGLGGLRRLGREHLGWLRRRGSGDYELQVLALAGGPPRTLAYLGRSPAYASEGAGVLLCDHPDGDAWRRRWVPLDGSSRPEPRTACERFPPAWGRRPEWLGLCGLLPDQAWRTLVAQGPGSGQLGLVAFDEESVYWEANQDLEKGFGWETHMSQLWWLRFQDPVPKLLAGTRLETPLDELVLGGGWLLWFSAGGLRGLRLSDGAPRTLAVLPRSGRMAQVMDGYLYFAWDNGDDGHDDACLQFDLPAAALCALRAGVVRLRLPELP